MRVISRRAGARVSLTVRADSLRAFRKELPRSVNSPLTGGARSKIKRVYSSIHPLRGSCSLLPVPNRASAPGRLVSPSTTGYSEMPLAASEAVIAIRELRKPYTREQRVRALREALLRPHEHVKAR